MNNKTCSIITPCFNNGKLIYRLLDSILLQDYPYIEMLIVDDGSTDTTKDVIKSYISKFNYKGYTLEYKYQNNQGQSVAINNALKWIKGEFLTWPDSDDFYNTNDAISKLIKKFSELPDDFGMIKTIPKFVNQDTLETINTNFVNDVQERQFEQALYNKNFPWPPGNYIIKMSAFDATNPQREIYTNKKAGQNWQMILPVLYSYKCYTLQENIFSVLVRNGSHSRTTFQNIRAEIEQANTYEQTILKTLDRIQEMPETERNIYKKKIIQKYAHIKFLISCSYQDIKMSRKYKDEIIKSNSKLSLKESLKFFLIKFPLLYSLLQRL